MIDGCVYCKYCKFPCKVNINKDDGSIAWISIKDQLPGADTTVLCCQESGEVTQVYLSEYNGGTWVMPTGKTLNIYRDAVTYWMPLPAAPKKQ